MEEIIRDIVEDKGLKFEESTDDLLKWTFCYNLDKDGAPIEDYYLFVFFDLAEVREKYQVTESLGPFLNSESMKFIEAQKAKKKLSSIDLSLIAVVCVAENEKLKRLFSMEEDSYVIKKYLLPYSVTQKNELEAQRALMWPILKEFQMLCVENSELLKDASVAWYQLLLSIYIKLPFLKLDLMEEDRAAYQDIKEIIRKRLSDEQQALREKLHESQDPSEFIKKFLLEYKDNGTV